MERDLFTFSNQKRVVDYIAFKFQDLELQPTKVSHYLSNLRFNVYKESGKLVKTNNEPILVKKINIKLHLL